MRNNFMTFNLKYDFVDGGANDWDIRSKRIAKIIKDNDPLCIGIQEGLIHMLNDMNRELGEYSFVGEGRDGFDKGEYSAIFYKKNELELIKWKQFWLSETPLVKGSKSFNSACTRICTWAKFKEKKSGKKFIIYNTHLDNESKLAREEGIKIILQFARLEFKSSKVPFIIMGDFNCYLDDKIFKIVKEFKIGDFYLRNVYDEVSHSIKGTFHDFKGGYDGGIIDFILISNGISCKKLYIDDRTIYDGYPSDHYPVIAELEIS